MNSNIKKYLPLILAVFIFLNSNLGVYAETRAVNEDEVVSIEQEILYDGEAEYESTEVERDKVIEDKEETKNLEDEIKTEVLEVGRENEDKLPENELEEIIQTNEKEETENKLEESVAEEELRNEMGSNPDGLAGPVYIKAPYIQTYAPGSLGPFKEKVFKMNSVQVQNHPGDYENIEPPAPGSLDINKTATPTANPNQWKINLTLTGKDIITTSDIVLVIDRSASMSGSKMTAAKAAAIGFVNTLLGEGKVGTRISVVSFSGDVVVNAPFTNDKTTLLNAINGLNANGGTFIQAAIRQASAQLNGSSANQKNIVLLGDGVATYSYGISNPSNYLEYYRGSGNNTDYRTTSAVPQNQFIYNSTVGNGTSDYTRISTNSRNYYRHGASSVAEAGFAKAKGYEIYSIALDAGTEGNWTLNGIASPGKSYTGSSSDLSQIFQTIAGSISYAATDATITDPMGPMFSIPGINSSNYASKITVNRGTISWDNATETITWNLPRISEGNSATMSYIVEIDSSAESGVLYPTNEHTYVDYTNALNTTAKKSFPIPEVGINAGCIKVHHYRVNAAGQPINSSGVVITKEQAELESYNYPGGPFSFNTPYEVTGPDTITVGGIQYRYNAVGNVGDPNPTEVTLTPSNPSQDVWFGYEELKYISVGVKKTITGNMADMEGSFAFTVEVEGEEELREFNLSHDQTHTLENIPMNTVLNLTEESEGYNVTVKIGSTVISPNQDGSYTIPLGDKDTSITVTNNKNVIIDTGISLDNLPYILMLALSGLGALGIVISKRRYKIK